MAGLGDDYLNNVLRAARQGVIAGAGKYGQRCDGLTIQGDLDYFLTYALGAVFLGLASQYGAMVTFFNGIGDTEMATSCARKQMQYSQWAQTMKKNLVIPGNLYDQGSINDSVTAVITK